MRSRALRLVLTILGFLMATSSVSADDLEIVVHAQGRSPFPSLSGGVEGRIFFADEPVLMLATITFVADPSPGATRNSVRSFVFPTREWVDALEWRTINRSDRIAVPTIKRIVRSGYSNPTANSTSSGSEAFVLRDGETASAMIELLGLKPGDYLLEGRLGKESSQPDDRGFFAVRRGDEDSSTARLFYRYRADKVSKDFRQYEALMRELMAKFEPGNVGILVDIADWSVDKVPAEETVRLYREARAMLERRGRAKPAGNSKASEPSKSEVSELMAQLSTFERVLPYYRDHHDELRFGSTFVGGKRTYAWFPRKGGLMIDVIDAARPGPPRQRAMP